MYEFQLSSIKGQFDDFVRLTKEHYEEMSERLEKDGLKVSPYAPMYDRYIQYNNEGWLLFFTVSYDKNCIGYCLIYVTNDMHNGDIIAQEDALFVTRNHRNGVGKKLVQFVLAELKERKVKRGYVSAVTDLRVAKLWARMGFKNVATQMVYEF